MNLKVTEYFCFVNLKCFMMDALFLTVKKVNFFVSNKFSFVFKCFSAKTGWTLEFILNLFLHIKFVDLNWDKIRCKKSWKARLGRSFLSSSEANTVFALFDNLIFILFKFNCNFLYLVC